MMKDDGQLSAALAESSTANFAALVKERLFAIATKHGWNEAEVSDVLSLCFEIERQTHTVALESASMIIHEEIDRVFGGRK